MPAPRSYSALHLAQTACESLRLTAFAGTVAQGHHGPAERRLLQRGEQLRRRPARALQLRLRSGARIFPLANLRSRSLPLDRPASANPRAAQLWTPFATACDEFLSATMPQFAPFTQACAASCDQLCRVTGGNDGGPAEACTSARSCSSLGAVFGGTGVTKDVCGASTLSSNGCSTSTSWRHAALICASEGARLCTLEEARHGEAAGTGCGYDSERIWTADVDVCGRGAHMSAGGTPDVWDTLPPECSDDGTDHKVRCCADKVVGSVCEVPCTSTRSCEELGWPEVEGSQDHICGTVGRGCPHMNFVGAEAECASMGARLCTIEELGSGEAHGTGCGFDSERVWTSSVGSCGTAWGTTVSHLSAHGHPNEWSSPEGAPECTEDSTVLAVRCCADEVAGLLSCEPSSDSSAKPDVGSGH